MTLKFTESELESLVLGWLESFGWQVKHGLEIAPSMLSAVQKAAAWWYCDSASLICCCPRGCGGS